MLTRWWALLAAPLLLGCERAVAPILVEGAERFQPPPAYRLWWELTQECSGRRGLFSRVRWYYVPGAVTIVVDGRRVEGYWSAPNTIVLAEAAMLDGPLVRHEMLHALQDGDGHPREFFLDRCGGVVLCEGRCIEDAGPPPVGPAAPRVDPAALEVGLELRPRTPSLATYGGHFTVIVTARNPRSEAVVATLPATPLGEPSTSFEYRVENVVGADGARARAWDESVTRFAPGETKRHVFDVHLFGAAGAMVGGLFPGSHHFFGAYGGHWTSTPVTLTVP